MLKVGLVSHYLLLDRVIVLPPELCFHPVVAIQISPELRDLLLELFFL